MITCGQTTPSNRPVELSCLLRHLIASPIELAMLYFYQLPTYSFRLIVFVTLLPKSLIPLFCYLLLTQASLSTAIYFGLLKKWRWQMKPEKENIIAEFRDEPKHLVIEYSNFAHFKLCNCLQVTSMSALQRTISSSANYGVLPTEELKPGFSVERFVCGRSFQKQTLIKLKNSGKSFFLSLTKFL